MKLHIEDLQVSSFVPQDGEGDAGLEAVTLATCRLACQSGGGGQICVTHQYDTCETGPVYYC